MSDESLLQPASQKHYDFLTSEAYITVFGGSAGCLPLDAEYLSSTGWKAIGSYDGGLVGQYNHETGNVELVKPIEYIKLPCSNLQRMQSRGLDFILSPEHRVAFFNDIGDKKKIRVISFNEMIERHKASKTKGWTGKIKTTFSVDRKGIPLSEFEIRLMVAFQADGSLADYESHCSRIRVSKQRKAERLEWILDNLGIDYKHHVRHYDIYANNTEHEFRFNPPRFSKSFDSFWWDCSQEQLEIIADEVGHWDGSFVQNSKNKTIRYFTVDKANADFIQYVFHAVGLNTSFVKDNRKNKYVKTGTCYTVNGTTTGNGFRCFANKDGKCEVVDYQTEDGFKYCFSVPSTFLVIRQNGKIFITGNSGKTHYGLVRHLQYCHHPRYVGYVVRKTAAELKQSGGAFDLAQVLFKAFHPKVRFTRQPMVAYFPSGAKIQFIGLDETRGKNKVQGIEIGGAMCDEATHFSEDEFWWLTTRLRSPTGITPNIWATCNPDPDSFLFKMVEWYLYPKGTYVNGELVEGRPDPAKNGRIRWFIKSGDETFWGESEKELKEKYPQLLLGENKPKSFRFIGATCHDNPINLRNNPDYPSTLLNQGRINAERLYYGNWLAREESAGFFKRDWVEIIETPPDESQVVKRVRAWDIAGTLPSETNPDPDYTAGVQMCRLKDGTYLVEDVVRDRKRFNEVYKWIAEQAIQDFKYHRTFDVFIPQDPAAAGKYAADCAKREIRQYGVFVRTIKTSTYNGKLSRFKPFSAAAEAGAIKVLKADWNDAFFSELERFDGTRRCGHDDQTDATSDAFSKLAVNRELPTSFISTLPNLVTR